MPIKGFRDIVVWQKSRLLAVQIYQAFSPSRDFSFRDQIQRAAVSIMNNIAEGFERRSRAEFKRFLTIAKGSAAEVDSMLELALDLHYIPEANKQNLSCKTEEILKMLHGLIKSIDQNS